MTLTLTTNPDPEPNPNPNPHPHQVMATSPGGTTPLTEAVMQLVSLIEPAAAQLRARGQQAVVVLATDGMPNDPPSFLAALQQLQLLPVWTVVRLCTDDPTLTLTWPEPGPTLTLTPILA